MNKQLRKTLIAILDDEHGISANAYEELQTLPIEKSLLANPAQPSPTADIFDAVKSAEGRYYLPEDHGIVA